MSAKNLVSIKTVLVHLSCRAEIEVPRHVILAVVNVIDYIWISNVRICTSTSDIRCLFSFSYTEYKSYVCNTEFITLPYQFLQEWGGDVHLGRYSIVNKKSNTQTSLCWYPRSLESMHLLVDPINLPLFSHEAFVVFQTKVRQPVELEEVFSHPES